MKIKSNLCALALAAGAFPFSAPAATKIEATKWRAFDAFKLSDGRSEAVVVPAIGRVMSFGLTGGANWLWNASEESLKADGFKNWGGDKLYIAPHSEWLDHSEKLWPPLPEWDGPAFKSKVSGEILTIAGPTWKGFGVRLWREFTFKDGALVITNKLEKGKGEAVRVAAWSLTQCAPPDRVLFPLNPDSPYKNSLFWYSGAPADATMGGTVQVLSAAAGGFSNVQFEGGRNRGGRGESGGLGGRGGEFDHEFGPRGNSENWGEGAFLGPGGYTGGGFTRSPGFGRPTQKDQNFILATIIPTAGRYFNVAADAPKPVIMAVRGDMALVQSAEKEEGTYPDGAYGAGLPLAFYNHGAPGAEQYAEMKLFSPLKLLRAGQTLTHVVTWKLAPLGEARGALASAEK